jgi:hypothetical protein
MVANLGRFPYQVELNRSMPASGADSRPFVAACDRERDSTQSREFRNALFLYKRLSHIPAIVHTWPMVGVLVRYSPVWMELFGLSLLVLATL